MTIQSTLIYNPESGRGKKKRHLPRVLDWLAALEIDAQPAPTDAVGHATDLARDAVRQGSGLVIAWGGDGTINEIARGMLGSSTPLGILPGGTVNVLARATGIPRRLKQACRVLRDGRPTAIPVGMAAGRPFLLMAGIGIDAEVVHRLDPGLKKNLGKWAFWLQGFRLLATYSFPPLTLRIDGRELTGTGLIAGKVRLYGNGYVITPEARLEEPLLDVVVFQGHRRLDYFRYLVGVVGGFHLRFPDVVHLKAARLEVESRYLHRVQLDGEPAGEAPVLLEVLPDALTVVLP
jgi:diacylglycerol kinase (ATP)